MSKGHIWTHEWHPPNNPNLDPRETLFVRCSCGVGAQFKVWLVTTEEREKATKEMVGWVKKIATHNRKVSHE